MNCIQDNQQSTSAMEESALKFNALSAEDYLSYERRGARQKHELHQGRLVALQGAGIRHNRVVRNLLGELIPHLKGKPCEVFPGNLRIYIPTEDSFTYPDISIVCDGPELICDAYQDTVKNPCVIIEVLNHAAENYDRGYRFFNYMQIPALKEYIVVSPVSRHIFCARKKADGLWQFTSLFEKNAKLTIPVIQFSMNLDDVYDRVDE